MKRFVVLSLVFACGVAAGWSGRDSASRRHSQGGTVSIDPAAPITVQPFWAHRDELPRLKATLAPYKYQYRGEWHELGAEPQLRDIWVISDEGENLVIYCSKN